MYTNFTLCHILYLTLPTTIILYTLAGVNFKQDWISCLKCAGQLIVHAVKTYTLKVLPRKVLNNIV